MAVIDRIKFDGPPETLVSKYEKDNVTLGGQLIVNESQEALFFKGGQAFDLFGPGTHTLSTKNLPLLQKLVNLPFGGQTPFAAEVYFVNKTSRLDYKWGTRTPIPIEDPKYKVLLSVGCYGQFGLRVADSRTFVTQIVGTLPTMQGAAWDGAQVLDYFRGVIITRVKDTIAKFVVEKNVSVGTITAYIDELSRASEERMRSEFAKYGLDLLKFFISAINVPHEELEKIQKGAFQNLEIEQMGDKRYVAMRSLNALEDAASNPGAPGTLMGAGVGFGMGAQMAGGLGNVAGQAMQATMPTAKATTVAPAGAAQAVAAGMQSCAKCGGQSPANSKFCNQCGAAFTIGIVCPACKTTLPAATKFCNQCGAKLSQPVRCASCGTELPEGSKFCSQCGAQSAQS